jgi:enamine deaminase RidA (YjgF/YER057c/UK114 family)
VRRLLGGLTQAYVNLKKVLADYGATLDLLVEEVLYVTDMDAAFAVAARSASRPTVVDRSWPAPSW